jgi:hypothetical protein
MRNKSGFVSRTYMKKAPRSGSSDGHLLPPRKRIRRFIKSRKTAIPRPANEEWSLDKCKRILYLGASPPGTAPLDLFDEVRAIKAELRGGRHRCFELVNCFGSTADDLIRELREVRPLVVQIGGHSCTAGMPQCEGADAGTRDVVAVDRVTHLACERGLVLHGRDGQVYVLPYQRVRKIFELAGSSVTLAVTTACESEPLAELLLDHVACAIGVQGPITDRTAVAFSRGLYAAVSDGASIAQAYEAGRLAVECAEAPGADRIKLLVRDGIDARKIVLAASPLETEADVQEPSGPRPSRSRKLRAQRGMRRHGKASTQVARRR